MLAWGVAFNSYVAMFALWFLVWYWMGRYIDPDWDQQGMTQAEGRIQRELGLLAVFALPVSTFYASQVFYLTKLLRIKGAIGGTHRTWLTHSPIGTFHRCLLICMCASIMVNWADFILGTTLNGTLTFHPYDLATFLLAMFAGLGTSDMIHVIRDGLQPDG